MVFSRNTRSYLAGKGTVQFHGIYSLLLLQPDGVIVSIWIIGIGVITPEELSVSVVRPPFEVPLVCLRQMELTGQSAVVTCLCKQLGDQNFIGRKVIGVITIYVMGTGISAC
jgi:hypothetical protein